MPIAPPTAPPTIPACALCGLTARAPILAEPVRSDFSSNGEPLAFCCGGCRNVWCILEESGQIHPGVDPRELLLFQQAAQAGLIARPEPADNPTPLPRPGDGAIDPAPVEATPSDEFGHIDDIRECSLRLDGMWCSSCAWLIAATLRKQRGVVSASVSFATDSARIAYKPARLGVPQLLETIRSLGYAADEAEGAGAAGDETFDEASRIAAARKQRRRSELIRAGIALFFAMDVMMITPALYSGQFFAGMTHFARQFLSWLLLGFSVPVVIAAWPTIFHRAWQAARRGAVGMETLISIGAGVALAYSLYETARGFGGRSYFDTADMLLALILLGKYIESNIRASANDSLSLLHGLMPRKATLVTAHGREQMVAAARIAPGDTLRVRAGEQLAADGEITRGQGSVDESLLTGESRPIAKQSGDHVIAGSVLADGSIDIRVQRAPGDADSGSDSGGTTLQQLAALVQDALHRKTRAEETADRISRVFVPLVLALAALAALIVYFAPFAHHQPSSHSLAAAMTRAVAVLVIACPCALGIATPMAVLAAVAAAARRGILVADPEALLDADRLAHIVFDKTGTLTEGRFRVQTVLPEQTDPSVIAAVAVLEQSAEHPIARAIQAYAASLALDPARTASAADFLRHPGLGVTGRIHGRAWFIGSPALAERCGAVPSSELTQSAGELSGQGQTVVLFGETDPPRVLGLIALGDTLRPEASALTAELARAGITCEIVSGDSPATVESVARQLGIRDYQGGVLPSGKSQLIEDRLRSLREQTPRARLAMMGDGVNDAPALARADVGIALASGAALTARAAGITLVGSRIERVLDLITIARATRRVIRQNLFWALGYNLVCLPLAILGLITPIWAAAAMLVSSLTVIANSRRLANVLENSRTAKNQSGTPLHNVEGLGQVGTPSGSYTLEEKEHLAAQRLL